MSENREKTVDDLMGKMTLDHKIGGVFLFDFMGTIPRPFAEQELRELHTQGFRVDTYLRGKISYSQEAESNHQRRFLIKSDRQRRGLCKDFSAQFGSPRVSPADYARTINNLRQIAIERPVPAPIHTTIDQENGGRDNYTQGKPRLFPNAMGLAATGDPDLVYRAMKTQARQLHAAGINWLHSPVLDVNTRHDNPEIGTRAFSDNPDTVAKFGLAMLRAFQEEKIIATGKHFPGRGHSSSNAHFSLPVVDVPLEDLMDIHVAPYRKMIAAGLPSIMTAHTLYPAIDPNEPATLSYAIMTELLRQELGFEGPLTTDNMTMGGIQSKYDIAEACVRALLAGCDLLLVRVETPLVFELVNYVRDAVKSGRLKEERLDQAVRRLLLTKFDYGLFENGGIVDPERAEEPQIAPESYAIEMETAQKASLVRNRKGLLPLAKETKVLLLDQVNSIHKWCCNAECHPSVFWEKMLESSSNVYSVEYEALTDFDKQRIEARIEEADVIVAAYWAAKLGDSAPKEYFLGLAEKFGKPIVVVTNNPFEPASSEDFDTVVNVFGAAPANLKVASRIIFGEAQAQGVCPVDRPGFYD